MTKQDLTKLRTHYQVLSRLDRFASQGDKQRHAAEAATANAVQAALDRLLADFPNIVPVTTIRDAHSHDTYYVIETLRAQVAAPLGTLDAMLATDASPVIDSRSFPFVQDAALRGIVERDYLELQRAFVSQCWKACIVLSGGVLEGVLTDLLQQSSIVALGATSAPARQTDITRWDLSSLIDVAVQLKLVSPAISKLSHPVREFRNLIHPGNEIRNQLAFGSEEARIAIEVVNILHRDLMP